MRIIDNSDRSPRRSRRFNIKGNTYTLIGDILFSSEVAYVIPEKEDDEEVTVKIIYNELFPFDELEEVMLFTVKEEGVWVENIV